MKKKRELRYFNFPVQLLQGFLIDYKECLINICEYSIYAYSLKLEFGESELVRFKSASKYYEVNFSSPKDSFNNGKIIFDSLPPKSPVTGLNVLIFNDYINNKKSDFEIVTLLAFLAMKSIIGVKKYCKMTNNYWLSRMNGNAKTIKDISQLDSEIRKYSTEYQLKKIKGELRLNWGLIVNGRNTRGYYVSFVLSMDQFELIVLKKGKNYREKEITRKQEEARKKVLKYLNLN